MPEDVTIGPNYSRRTVAVVLTILVVQFGVTGYINRLSHSEHERIAAAHFEKAERLMDADGVDEAIEEYHAAVMMRRDDLLYQQALARALFRKGALAEAKSYLRPLLESDPIDGATNLLMARALSRETGLPAARGFKPPSIEQVESFYRRAVYGHWSDDAPARRLAARFELIDLLRGSGRSSQAVAELLALAEETPGDPGAQARIANLLLESGAAAQSAGLYRKLVESRPRDSDLREGLGHAEFELGDYAGAQRSFRLALRARPEAPKLRGRLDVVNEILALDPFYRRVSAAERARRAAELLARVEETAAECGGSPLLEQAKTLRESRRPDPESMLDLAASIWSGIETSCPAAAGREALQKVMARVESR